MVPRLALVFVVGAVCGILYNGGGETSSSPSSHTAAVAQPASSAKPTAAASSAKPTAAVNPSENVAASPVQTRAPTPRAKPSEAKRAEVAEPTTAQAPGPAVAAQAPAAAAPVLAVPNDGEAQTETNARSRRAARARAVVDTDDEVEAAPRNRRSATAPRPASRTSSRPSRTDPPGLRYVGTRVLPDGSRIPVYRREPEYTRRAYDEERPMRRRYFHGPFASDFYD